MIIEKPIISAGTLTNNNKNVYYSPLFLEKIASQKGDVVIELDRHEGLSIGKATKLDFKDNKLIATMDIPDDYITYDVDIGFSTEIIPSQWNGEEVIDGYLNSITFLSNLEKTQQPNDKSTITRLYNTEEDSMSEGNNELSKMYGKLQKEKEILEAEINDLKSEKEKILSKHKKLETAYEKLQKSYDEGKALYDEGKQKFDEVNEIAKKYQQEQKDKKDNLLEKLVPKDEKGVQDEFKLNMYNKLSIDELETLIKDEPQKPSTPPNGASGSGIQTPPPRNDGNEDSNIYLKYKEAYNL